MKYLHEQFWVGRKIVFDLIFLEGVAIGQGGISESSFRFAEYYAA